MRLMHPVHHHHRRTLTRARCLKSNESIANSSDFSWFYVACSHGHLDIDASLQCRRRCVFDIMRSIPLLIVNINLI
eukprot:m.306019 g.306019  ORF g.306019 m.306019 type:complete len:76 (+) comp15914_c1_seq5:1909-2136(+)